MVEDVNDQTSEERTGRDRMLDALRRPRVRGQLTAAALLAVVGFASVVQVQANEQDDDYEGARQEDLIQILNSLAAASERAENEIAQLEQTRSALRNDTNSRQAALEAAREQANVLGILAGTLPAVGPGVRITVHDPTGAVGTDQLLNGLQELRNAGAEAIEINNQVRIVAQSAIEDGDAGMVIDGQQVTPPYIIEAIGSPDTLSEALDFRGGFIFEIERVNGRVEVEDATSVEIATTREPDEADFAEPVTEE